VILAHKTQIDPTVEQRIAFARNCGTARLVYNWALNEWNEQFKAGLRPSAGALRAQFNKIKYDLFPWLKGIARDAHSQPFADLEVAFKRYFKKLARRPKFKSKGKARDSFYVANDVFRLDGGRVRLPRIGWVRLRESLRFAGKIMSARVSRTADKWFISISVDVGDLRYDRKADGQVGVDLGLKSFAVLSTGESFDSPRPLRFYLKKLARLQRSFSRKKRGSNNREKLKVKIARLYARISNIRKDFIHKLTTDLSRKNQTVVVEDLLVSGMIKNRKLSRAISDSGWGEFRWQLEYKLKLYGGRLVVINRFFPSSKLCSGCGSKKDSLALSTRTYVCEACGMSLDRDHNAAINILAAGLAVSACGPEGSGCCRETPVKPRRVEARTKPGVESFLLTN
jgi:putative transposase